MTSHPSDAELEAQAKLEAERLKRELDRQRAQREANNK